MRLSHWDFRPKQRRKYVAAGSADGRSLRKRPALRIALLAAVGGLVYLKYDDVVQSPALESLRHPERLWQAARDRLKLRHPLITEKAPGAYSADSAWMEWTCAAAARDSCLEAWDLPSTDARGAIRAALHKGQALTGFPDPGRFSAVFQRSPAPDPVPPESASEASREAAWTLARVELFAGERSLTWAMLPDRSGTLRWCSPGAEDSGHCPDAATPQPPARRYVSAELLGQRPPVLRFRTASDEAIRPILPGRILDLPGGPDGWLKVHHGGTLFSYYSGFARLRPGLAAGSSVGEGDTLGFAGPAAPTDSDPAGSPDSDLAGPPDSAPDFPLLLRVEKDGLPADPQAFLGLDAAVAAGPDDSGTIYVR